MGTCRRYGMRKTSAPHHDPAGPPVRLPVLNADLITLP